MQEQLHEAQRLLVVAEQGRDYADAVVRYHQACIARLESKLNSSAANLFRTTLPGDELDTAHCGRLYAPGVKIPDGGQR